MTKQRKPMKKAVAALLAVAMAASVGTGVIGVAAADPAVPNAPYAGKYFPDYDSLAEAKKAAEELTREIAQEGDVLLKNANKALPLKGNEWVSVFGVKADAMIGASDSSGAWSGNDAGGYTLTSALENAGFKVNPTLREFYANNSGSIGKENTTFNGNVKSSFDLYNDVAIISLSREGGEGSDASRVTSETVKGSEDNHKALKKKVAATQPEGPGGPGGQDAPAPATQADDDEYYKHSLMLTDSEIELIEMVKTKFKKVVIVTNTSNPMEIGDLKNDPAIDAIVHIGRPGSGGLNGLADILNGTVSPSGGLVDEWAVDFTADPTWYNFGNNNQTEGYNCAAGSSTYYYSDGTKVGAAGTSTAYEGSEGYYGVDYEENIYLGYKYYETVYTEIAEGHLTYNAETGVLTETANSGADKIEKANAWWTANVAYPFGYGMSYTKFSFNINGGLYTDKACKTAFDATTATLGTTNKASLTTAVTKLYVPVTVKNTGSVAGKKTVQVYVTAPWDNTMVEKAAVNLVGFAKSDTLAPGEEQTVVVEFNVQDMASWDSTAANGNGTNGHYILDAGEYIVRAMENSHYDYATDLAKTDDAYAEVKFTLGAKVDLKVDDFSGGELKNLFTTGDNDVSSGAEVKVDDLNYGNVRTADMMATGGTAMTLLSRKNLVTTFPEAPKMSDLKFKDNILDNWAFWDNFVASNTGSNTEIPSVDESKTYFDRAGTGTYDAQKNYVNDKSTDPWYKTKTDIPQGWTQATGVYDENHMVQTNRTQVKIPMWVSQAKDSPIKYTEMFGVAYDDPKWDQFLNQLTYDELCSVVEFGGYSTVDIASVGKIKTEDSDGPNNWDSSHCWCSEDLIASTWNVELAEKQGKLMGNLGLLKDPTSTQTGWYGPGADIHRSPFSGRNNEYYSQDGLHSGYMAAAVINGVQSKGIVCYVKHCFMNDQETNRGNLFTWASEQSIRETYSKAFQMALQEGGSKGAMVGYGRLGGLSNTNNYNMNTELYQKQWGTQASFVTDGYIGWRIRTSPDMMVRAGNVFELWTTPFVEYLSGEWDADKGTVVLSGMGSETPVESYTQWYCVRQCAKSVLYNTATTAAQRNGYGSLVIPGGALAAGMQGVKYEGSVSINSLIDSDSTAKITVNGMLPAGLEIDDLTGEISGTPTIAGNYMFKVDYVIDGYIQRSANYTLKIDSALGLDVDGDDVNAMKVGEEFMTRIVSTEFTTDKYTKVEYAVKSGNLPAGVTLDKDGKISGTPTAAGTYTVVIEMTAEKESSGGGSKTMSLSEGVMVAPARMGNKGGSTTETTKVEYAITFVISGEGGSATEWVENVPYIGENGNWFVNGVDTGKPSKGIDGINGESAAGNVAGVVLGSIALAIALGATAAGVVLYVKKRKQN